jgi:hypothetical protein
LFKERMRDKISRGFFMILGFVLSEYTNIISIKQI